RGRLAAQHRSPHRTAPPRGRRTGRSEVVGYFEGFGVTFRKLRHGGDKGRIVTVEYPKQKRPKAVRLHGRHVLNRYEDGMEKCIGCELCAGVCPARCIYVRGMDNQADVQFSTGERYGQDHEITTL